MNATYLLGVLAGIVAALLINVGKGVQKQKVHVFLAGRKMFSPPHRRDLLIWCVGLLMTTSAVPPYGVALNLTGSPSTVGAMTGVGLIGLTLYAVFAIGERLGPGDAVGIALVVVGTSLLGYLGSDVAAELRAFATPVLVRTLALLFLVCGLGCVSALFYRRVHGVAFGLTAGACLGCALFLVDAGIVRSDGSLRSQLSNPYPYIAVFGFGTLAMVLTQIAFLRGRALEVVPAVNSATILAPLVLEIGIYGLYPTPLKLAIVVPILIGVVLLSTGSAGRAQETAPSTR